MSAQDAWEKLNEEYNAAKSEELAALAVLNKKFGAIARKESMENPTAEEIARHERALENKHRLENEIKNFNH